MYFPYFRGKQYELITIRETAALMCASNIIPIIEPVREQLSGLAKTLNELVEANTKAVVIVNPFIGHYSDDDSALVELLRDQFHDANNINYGVLLTEAHTAEHIVRMCSDLDDRQISLIHAGFADGLELSRSLVNLPHVSSSIFLEAKCGKLYQRHFRDQAIRILVRDGFKKRRNKDHPDLPELFSDLHVTYEFEGATGFGDFLIVGDEYSEGGGPAYTVAIHITFIDPTKENVMMIQHFKSDSQETPQNPAGKFAEALRKLMRAVDAEDSHIIQTSAIDEFRELSDRGHYPGLGYVKKLSMKHHIETLAVFM